ncbi:MAG: thiamine pyrophosphate-binding protein [Gammaproteobacteria bacterium]|nr:thiamine pyrophosphate-binding protein [Gammaproteobacteria bacterium]
MSKDTLVDGGELCVKTLKSAGCEHIFCLHGGHLDPIFQACIDYDVRLIDMRHEAAVGHAADAYARQTGKPGVALATAGPGFTNAITAITQAYLDRIPVLFIIGASPLRDAERWPLQGGLDQIGMVKPITKWAGQVTQTELIPHLIKHALRMTCEGAPGPAVLEIPIDILFNRVQPAEDEAEIRVTRPAPSETDVDAALALLASAERPAIICGGGMLFSDAAAKLKDFVEKTGIPVYSNGKARGVLPSSHPLSAQALTNMKVAEATGVGMPDVALTLGIRFGMFTEPGMLGPGRLPPDGCKIIQVDVSGAEIGRLRPVDLGVVADCGTTLDALLAKADSVEWPDWSAWSGSVRGLTEWHQLAYAKVCEQTQLMHPYAAVREIVKTLPQGSVICADGGETSVWAEMVAQPEEPGELMGHGYLGCLGIGMPFAIGAKLANPEKVAVVIVGDGSAGFNIQEFDTMVRHDLPVITIVLNNKAWGMCVHGQQSMFGDNRLVVTQLADARYEAVAEGFGCEGELIEKLDDIAPALEKAIASGKPTCLNVIVDLSAAVGDTEGKAIKKAEIEDKISMPYYEDLDA